VADRTVKVQLKADISSYTSGLAKAAAETKALGGAADTAGRNTKTSLDGAGKSAQDAARQVAKIREQIAALGRAKIGVDTVAARTELAQLRKRLQDIDNTDANPRVDAETAAAEAQLRAVQSQLNRIDGQSVRAHVDVDDSGATQRAAANLLTLSAAAQAVAPALGAIGAAAVAGIGAIGPLAASAASGLGVLALGFSGVSDTVKLLQQRHEAVAVQAGKSAGSQVNSAQQIESAQASLANAQASAADAGIRAAERVADARRNETRAARDAADGIQAALQRQQDAEETLTREQRTQRQAQLDLISARREAAQQLEDLTASVEENSLAQRSSVLDVAQAQRELNDVLRDPKASNEERERARIAYEEQVFRQKQLSVQGKRLAAERADANAKGIEGSDQVAAAQQRVTAADESVADATRAVGRAAADVQKARVDGAEKIADAQRQVVDAVREQTAQQRQSAFTIAQAQRAVQAAMTATGAAGASALTGIDNKLAQVGPSTRKFAEFVDGTLRPAFQRLQETAAAGVLPGVQTGLEGLLAQEPRINKFVGAMATSIGGLIENSIGNLSNPAWQQFWSMLETRGVPELEAMWHTGDNIAESFASIVTAFGPLSSDVAAGVEHLSQDFADWAAQLGGSSGFHQFEAYVREQWPKIEEIIRNVAVTVGHLIEAGAPIAGSYLTGFKLLSDVLAGLPVGVVQALLTAFLGFRGVQSVVGTLNGVADSVIALRTGVTGLPDKVEQATKGMGRFKGAATGLLGVLGGPWGIALAGAGAAVAGLSAYYEDQDRKLHDLTETAARYRILIAGGGETGSRAAGQLSALNKEIAGQEAGIAAAEAAQRTSIGTSDGYNESLAISSVRIKEQKAALEASKGRATELAAELGPVGVAQLKVADATKEYNRQVTINGQNSPQARAAYEALTTANDGLATAQDQVNNGLKTHAQLLDDARNKTLEANDADLALAQSSLRVDQALQSYNNALRDGSPAERAQAEIDLRTAVDQAAEAARRKAVADAAGKSETEKARLGNEAYISSLQAAADKMDGPARDAILALIGNLQRAQAQASTTKDGVRDLGTTVEGLPKGHYIGIDVPTADQMARLKAMGVRVNQLPDGSIAINLDDDGARLKLNTLLSDYGSKPVYIPLKAGSAYAEGGYTGPGGKYDPAGVVHRGEYVFTKEQTAKAGVSNLHAYARALDGYAQGGVVGAGDYQATRWSSLQIPANLHVDLTPETMAGLRASMDKLATGPAGGRGQLGADWMSIYRVVHAAIPQARINSTYRAGDPGYHGRNKAIDFGFGSGPGGAGSAGLAAIARFLYAGYGKTLAELIYDGVGDNTPDVKNGQDHTYNAATRAEHRNHVHAAVYHEGVDSVPADGWAYLAKGEAVVPAEANARSREFSGATAPAAAGARGLEGLRLVGTLDLGGGLEGRIDARVDQAFTGVANQLHYAGV
jgi:hypothetical protein